MDTFSDRLASLLAAEASAAKHDPDRLGAMVERVARGLGFTVAIACRGEPKAIDEMMAGAEGYAHEEAVDKADFIRLMARLTGGHNQ